MPPLSFLPQGLAAGASEPEELYDPSEIEHWPAPVPENESSPDKLIARFPRLYRRFGAPRLG